MLRILDKPTFLYLMFLIIQNSLHLSNLILKFVFQLLGPAQLGEILIMSHLMMSNTTSKAIATTPWSKIATMQVACQASVLLPITSNVNHRIKLPTHMQWIWSIVGLSLLWGKRVQWEWMESMLTCLLCMQVVSWYRVLEAHLWWVIVIHCTQNVALRCVHTSVVGHRPMPADIVALLSANAHRR